MKDLKKHQKPSHDMLEVSVEEIEIEIQKMHHAIRNCLTDHVTLKELDKLRKKTENIIMQIKAEKQKIVKRLDELRTCKQCITAYTENER